MPQNEMRAVLLEVIADLQRQYGGNLQSGSVLPEAQRRLGNRRDVEFEQALLTAFHDLFRTGYLAWGLNLSNPNPPFFHTTEVGRRALKDYSRDPANPDGYLSYLESVAQLNPIALSYLREAIACYGADLPKAAAVMVGASAESLVLELRDAIAGRLNHLTREVPKELNSWMIRRVLVEIGKFMTSQRAELPSPLWESFEGYWPAFTQQIRAARNDAGHPSSIDPVMIDTVHASLLIYPELAKLAQQLRLWVNSSYT